MKNQMMTVQDDGYVDDYQPSFYIATKEFLLKKMQKSRSKLRLFVTLRT